MFNIHVLGVHFFDVHSEYIVLAFAVEYALSVSVLHLSQLFSL